MGNANHADGKGIVVANAKSLLRNILDSADEAIQKGGIAATLRFGHDGNVIPLVALMQIENCNVAVDDPYEVYKVWSDFKVVPMAANVQIAFFRNEKEVRMIFWLRFCIMSMKYIFRYRPTSFLSINGAMWRVTTGTY